MFFQILHQSKKSRARVGEINTFNGIIKTPSFVAVGTKGTVKSILPLLLKEIKTQCAFVNTYHLVTHPGVEIIEKAGGIHKYTGLDIPLMSDSGGFQIFSLARKKSQISNLKSQNYNLKFKINNEEKEPFLIRISDNGVRFRSVFDGSIIEFTPEKSIEYQKKIGADIIMAFDECIYYGADYQYTKKATERTHRWLLRSIDKFKSLRVNELKSLKARNKNLKNSKNFKNPLNKIIKNQYLYGIIQGGVYEDLRKQSVEFVVSSNVDGVAIGGVSVGESKKEMREQVRWVSGFLPKDKPVHLLGVGQIDDILDLVKYGIDTFDCVEPTRLARMGTIYQIKNQKSKIKSYNSKSKINQIDILKGKYRFDLSKVDENCDCYICQNFNKSYLHHLFKTRELLAYTLATYHNLWVMEKLFEWIREGIETGRI
ncbi:MAG: tRNA-guanine transglycosylase [Patescibacteria group bacterium]|nr:tRNA-guanine transglycosylase [Patescibacteria group bacterium]